MLDFSTLVVNNSSMKDKIQSDDSSCANRFSISLRSWASITSENFSHTYKIWSSLSRFHSMKSENKSIFVFVSMLFCTEYVVFWSLITIMLTFPIMEDINLSSTTSCITHFNWKRSTSRTFSANCFNLVFRSCKFCSKISLMSIVSNSSDVLMVLVKSATNSSRMSFWYWRNFSLEHCTKTLKDMLSSNVSWKENISSFGM